MKKKVIWIVSCLLLCVALAAGILIVRKIAVPESPTEEVPDFGLTVTNEGIRVYRFSPVNVDYMEVKNSAGTYRVRMSGGNVYIVGYENIPLLAASSKGLFQSVETLTLETVVRESCDDLSEFGLDSPQATVTIRSYGGKEVTFHIGDSSLIGDYYYMSVEGESTVYLIGKLLAERYLYSIAQYCDPKIYSTFEAPDDFTALTVKSPDQNYSFRLATAEEKASDVTLFSGILMEQPFRWGAESSQIQTAMESMILLQAERVVQMCVSSEDLAQYGLDPEHRTEIVLSVNADSNPVMYQNSPNPYYDSTKPTGTKQNFDITYYLGRTEEHETYLMFGDRAVVYTVPDSVFSWLEWTPYRYCYKMIYGEYITSVASIDILSPEKSTTFTLTHGVQAKELTVRCGERIIDEANFRTFYTNLLSMYPVGEVPADFVPGEETLKLVYHLTDGSEHVLSFSPVDDRNYAATLDGETHLCVRVSDLDKVLNDTEKLLNGQTVNPVS